jgi:hypothetical protein
MAPDELMRHAALALAAGDRELSEYYRREADRAGWREEATKVARLSRDPFPGLVLFREARRQVEAHPVAAGAVESLMDARATSWTADQLMHVTFPEVRWAVPQLIAEGLNLLCGAPKLGKSWLALNLGVAIASGGLALGRIPVEAGDVLYLALEDTGRRLQSRLRIVLAGDTAPRRLTLATTCEPIADGGAERIESWLNDHPDARLIIIDVFTRVRGQVSDRANRYDADYRAVATIKEIADRRSVAVLCVHHTRKQSADDFLDSVSGTQGIAGAADAVLVLARSRGSAQAVLKITGRDVEEAEHALDFAPDIGTWQLLDGPAGDYELGDTRRRILQHVREGDAFTPTEIAEALDLNLNTVKVTVRRMAEADQLDTDGAGHYFTPLQPVTPVTHVTEDGSENPQGYTGYTGYTDEGPP